jgi:hypothetical protein
VSATPRGCDISLPCSRGRGVSIMYSIWSAWTLDRPVARRENSKPTDGMTPGRFLDPQAKKAFRQRLGDLREDLAEAEEWNDSDRAERARAEIDALTKALAEAVGLGGRDRRAASSSERARLNVTRAVRSAMARIVESPPGTRTTLGRHDPYWHLLRLHTRSADSTPMGVLTGRATGRTLLERSSGPACCVSSVSPPGGTGG